jgi:hypothetical protein
VSHVLVVCTTNVPEAQLRSQVGADDVVRVVVPVVRQGVLDWLANDQRAFARADELAAEVAEELPTEPVAATAGESDVALAIRDALATYPADEIVVAVEDGSELALDGVVDGVETGGRRFDGIPLRWVVVR